MRTTIEDVAREAGVSIATVSRFINGPPGAVSPETGAKLRAVVDRLGYVPNPAARSLRTGRSRLIGVILSNIAHPYWSTVLSGVEEACQARGYSVIVSSAGDSVEVENRYLGVFLDQRVDGILLNPANADPATVARWAALTCPVITLDRTLPGLPFGLVAMDNELGAKLAVEHLLALGHRRIGFLSWYVANLTNRLERLRGYEETLAAAGVTPDPALVRFAADGWSDGVRQTVDLLAQPERPTAIVSAASTLNLQVLAGVKQAGLRVPEEISVVGYDESPWDPLLDPPLTTVATPAHQLGMTAADRLCAAIDGGDELPAEIRLQPRLIVRRSSAAPSPKAAALAERG
jgi:LacI family transcriptional regulator